MRAIVGSTCLLVLAACGRSPLDLAPTTPGAAGQTGAGHGGSSGASSGHAGTGGASGGGSGAAGASDAGGAAGPKKIGETCVERIDCESTFCANGVCCAMACDGACSSCAIAGSVGSCEPLRAGSPCAARCDGNTLATASCDGEGTCRPSPSVVCAPFACDAQAAACNSTCVTDAECFDAPCVDGSCGRTDVGPSCSSNAECASGFCADGVCCNVACQGSCVSCALPGRSGTCAPIDFGVPDPRGICRDQGVASCGTTGSCNGQGACAVYSLNTVCAPATCVGSTLTTGSCDGAGTCRSHSVSCAPLLCLAGVTTCADNCPGGDAICVPGAYCSGNEVCSPRKAAGQPCGSNHECSSFKCIPGLDGGPSSCSD